jgi:hypothetical protein
MAARAGRHSARGVALPHEDLAAHRRRGGRLTPLRRRIGQVQRRKVLRDLAQVVVGQVLDEVGHRRVAAPPLSEVDQLVVEVARGLAGDARKEPFVGGPALPTMTGGAGLDALRDRVGHLQRLAARRGGQAGLRRRGAGEEHEQSPGAPSQLPAKCRRGMWRAAA